jgi:DNA polymerase
MECGEINCVAFIRLQFAVLLSLRFRIQPGMPPRSKRSPASHPLAARLLQELAKESQKCRNCDLWRNAAQTVLGQGSSSAPIMLIGEVPGDQEDRQGKPFVGPAGTLLRMLLNEAGIDLQQVYLTNVAKHFKWEPRGKRRIHKTPNSSEIKACRFWLDAEIAALKSKVVVCLGATAAQALLGRELRVTQHRGKSIYSDLAPYVMATVHPPQFFALLTKIPVVSRNANS